MQTAGEMFILMGKSYDRMRSFETQYKASAEQKYELNLFAT